MKINFNKISAFMAEINEIPYAYERGEYELVSAIKECADDLFWLFANMDMANSKEAKKYYKYFLTDWEDVKRLR